jgi:2-keto-3-deoxy-L-rhamnonate aldolase RhmA
MNGFELRQKARQGGILYGTMWGVADPRQVDYVSPDDFDFIVVDTEHNPVGRDRVSMLLGKIVSAGIAPLVRVPSADPNAIRQALDAGAHGVVVPYCETPEEVRRCLAAARYRPLKGQRLEEAIRDNGPADAKLRAYLENYNRHSFFVIMIESGPGVENLEDLLAVEGVDAIFIGPHDLTVSLNVPEEYEHPEVQAAIGTIIRTANAHGIPAGTQWWSPELASRELELGGRFVLYSNLRGILRQGYAHDLAAIRRSTGVPGASS